MKSCTVIYNPRSGRVDFDRFNRIFKRHGYEAEIITTEYAEHAIEIIQELKYSDLVISIGGDGTFNEIMTGNLRREKPLLLAHIPRGTANDLGAMFGYTSDVYENLRILLKGKSKKIDICKFNDRPFVYTAGFGKFVCVSYNTPSHLKKRFGYFAYLVEGIKEFNDETKMFDIKYKIDDKEYSGSYSLILISNANRIAGINNFYKGIKLDDDKFEVLFCKRKTKQEILQGMYYLKTRDISKVDGFEFYRTNNLELEFSEIPNRCWSLDGEKFKEQNNKYKISIIKDISILLPKKNIKKLFIQEEV